MKERIHQFALIGSFLPLCWLGMMATHELGHVVSGYLTGGTVTKVVIHPLSISRTDVNPNPTPLVVVWADPVCGIAIPLVLWSIMAGLRNSISYLPRFFLGFCLIANGAYLGIGSFDSIGDAGQMLQNGSPIWTLWLFGIIAVPFSFLCWHHLGPNFGLVEKRGQVDDRAAHLSMILLAIFLATSFVLSPRT
ncbi:MAG: hypothetical protein KDA93_20385 [Planctomycetaceae bacterium]|nr:hypothetical protein [Planctomycetaceae bacterium]